MNSTLKYRIQKMRSKLDDRSPVAEIHVSSQLFITPDPICDRMVALSEITDTDRILEPSAGTGAILRAIKRVSQVARCDAVELNGELFIHLKTHFPDVSLWNGDFLEYQPDVRYSKIMMNPPFNQSVDIKHIQRALTLLEPDGVLTAICANGPRQQKELKPLADVWEPLPSGTFTYTGVSTALLRITR
ncbi:class I SAM-dependent methyltransferase [uncultured Cedecea sp.]|uniref:class I SAM-dependent methyltransferase n=1 Tax=uncultured Cedecea sp. TaxID=988762 RepID=UPI0026226FF8|nr:class I SAM-dependent methyltransferase [uncultured Cedecea sp.]